MPDQPSPPTHIASIQAQLTASLTSVLRSAAEGAREVGEGRIAPEGLDSISLLLEVLTNMLPILLEPAPAATPSFYLELEDALPEEGSLEDEG